MKINQIYPVAVAVLVAVAVSSCKPNNNRSEATLSTNNPFLKQSTLALQAPAFDKIKDGDYQPAIEEGIKQQQEEINKIANNSAEPTFENTLVKMEKSGQMLTRVNNVFNLVTAANTNPTLQKVQEEVAPKLAANRDAILLNAKLYQRVKALFNKRAQLDLDPESLRLLEFYEQKFELAGANLSDKAKDSLKRYNREEASLSAKFTSQVLAANKAGALVVDKKEDLAGLTDAELNAAADNAKSAKKEGKWMLSLQNTTQQPALRELTNRDTRKKLFDASYIRAERGDANDTRATITRIAQLHALEAKLLGYNSFAEWKLKDQMAQNPQAVQSFLDKLVPAATAKARSEAADIQSVIDAQKGGFKLQPYDWNFYAEQVRKAKYNLDENEVKPFFELNKVLMDGVFYAANQLYGLTFKERKDLPVYQEDVRVFDVFDKDGSQLGLFYCDYYKRDNKNGGAWMDNLVGESKLLGAKPVIYNVCNFTKPAPGQPALISADDAKTMFHEFGHGLHGLFAAQKYPSLASPNTSRDFVEFPSQFNEHWAYDPKIFAHYAVHYKTGAPMPQALVEKIKKAATFNQGYALTEALAADAIDLKWNTLPANAGKQDVDKFETAALHSAGLDLPQVPPRYRSSYFLHIWANGYAAGYYAYAWTEMLDDDAFSWFQQNGSLTRANGQRFRDMILSKGNTEEYGNMFKNFRGHAPDIHPMLESRGLVVK
ncbi:M3 family metallopeptidase [Mucilaginibacter ginkgonis]|uniref:Dipeptidyl carboxypeptidase n=1 Tax=Mucilaginibacter ginkgonis TaxID=2682091 RepID=A0A6I4I490_9SPHI|nr:M3 family metallopeptidase [Mucilaginibacter ginkgonis]QQL48871.1 M3 family metallopeptidase [Mucilaginibacter ginkgonis]